MKEMRLIYLRRNTIMSLTFELLTIICGFILPRYILQYFGSETNGLVLSITQFLGFISLCELGMGAVVPASLYGPLSNGNKDSVSCIIASAQKFYKIIAMIMLGYIAVLVGFYPLLVKSSFDFVVTAALIIIISFSTFSQYFFGITYSLLLKADQKQYVTLIINSVTIVLNTIIAVGLIKAGFSIYAVKLASAVIFIARPLCLTIYVKKHYDLNLKIKYSGEPIKQKWNGIAQHLASTIQEKADTVILTALSTLSMVSIYGVYFMVINGMRGLVYSLTAGMSALIGNMYARNEKEQLLDTFSNLEWLMHTLTTLLFTITGVLVVPFVQVYTNGLADAADYITPMFAIVLCFALAARCIQMPYNIVVQAAGHFKQIQTSAIVEPVINVIVSVVMVYHFGLIGVAIGTLVSMVYRAFYLAIYLMKNILFTSPARFIRQLLIDLITVLVMVLSTFWIKMGDISYFSWVLMSVVVATICCVECLIINAIFYKKFVVANIRPILNKITNKQVRGRANDE